MAVAATTFDYHGRDIVWRRCDIVLLVQLNFIQGTGRIDGL